MMSGSGEGATSNEIKTVSFTEFSKVGNVEERSSLIQNKSFLVDPWETRTKRGSTISFHDLRYEVRQKLNDVPLCGKTTTKQILCDVSGLLPPGLNVIMGPTGSGKTSLIDILAQRKDPAGLKKGYVILDGNKLPSNFRLMSGYVVQDDVVMGTLTVRENIAFSANLRLSSSKFDATAIEKKVQHVIDQLDLQSCADTLVGNEFFRGVSGGERKRVNIGMEMVLDPPVLFLDEPTSGLDANTAMSIVLLLCKLAREGRNITMSIHQPRYSIFLLFDRLILLNKGEIVYSGPSSNAVNHFTEIGFPLPESHNPADYFLDILREDFNAERQLVQIKNGSENYASTPNKTNEVMSNNQQEIVVAMDEIKSSSNGDKLVKAFKNSLIARKEKETLMRLGPRFRRCRPIPHMDFSLTSLPYSNDTQTLQKEFEQETDTTELSVNRESYNTCYANGFFRQIAIVSQRTILNIIRDLLASLSMTVILTATGILFGLVYLQIDTSFEAGLQNRTGVIFMAICAQILSNVFAMETFHNNRKFFIHESASGYYRVSVYFICLAFGDLVTNRIIPNVLFTLIVYFMVGFQLEVTKYLFFLLTTFLTTISSAFMTYCIGISVQSYSIAFALVTFLYVIMMLFGGFLANVASIGDWLEWLKYISIFRYGINALAVNELSGLVFIDNSSYPGFSPNSSQPCISDITTFPIPNCITGETYMDIQEIAHDTLGKWQNLVALFGMFVGYFLLAYIQLRRVVKFR